MLEDSHQTEKSGESGESEIDARAILTALTSLSAGDFSYRLCANADGLDGEIARAFNSLAVKSGNLASDASDIAAANRYEHLSNYKQNWIQSNIVALLRAQEGIEDVDTFAEFIVSALSRIVGAESVAFFRVKENEHEPEFRRIAAKTIEDEETSGLSPGIGEALIKLCLSERNGVHYTNVPGLGSPVKADHDGLNLQSAAAYPIFEAGMVIGIVELASNHYLTGTERGFLDQLFRKLGPSMVGVQMKGRTDRNNTAQPCKGMDREESDAGVLSEEKTLTLTAQDQDEFLANMSHDLRTPLNSMMILSQQLAENPDRNLTQKQIDHAKVIYASGKDLLSLINEIPVFSKINPSVMPADGSDTDTLRFKDKSLKGSNAVIKQENANSAEARLLQQNQGNFGTLSQGECCLEGKSVLIVDDDARIIFALLAILEDYKVITSHVTSGEDSLTYLKSFPDVDFVLMDIRMPGIGGLEAIKRIRSQKIFKELPIVALSGNAKSEDRKACLEAGASEHLTKPVDSLGFLKTVKGLFQDLHEPG